MLKGLKFIKIANWALNVVIVSLFAVGNGSAQNITKLSDQVNTDDCDEIAFLSTVSGDKFYFTRIGSPDFERALIDGGEDIGSNTPDVQYEELLSRVYSEIAGVEVIDPISSPMNQDIFIAKPKGNSWIIDHPGYPVNSALPNSAIGVMASNRGIYLLNQFSESGSMGKGVSKLTYGGDGGANLPKPMFVKDMNSKNNELSASVSPDGEIALFAMNRDGGNGDLDIYVSFYTGMRETWSDPKSIGDDINTPFRESTPYLSKDKRKLYFASNRPGGKGGADIYVSDRLNYSYDKWSKPMPIDDDVNTAADESHPCFVHGTQNFYFASNRDGSFDIFKYVPKEKNDAREITITGQILDAAGKPTSADLFFGPEGYDEYLEFHSTFNGKFKMVVRADEAFKFLAKKAGKDAEEMTINFDDIVPEGATEFNLDLFVGKDGEPKIKKEEEPIEKEPKQEEQKKEIVKQPTQPQLTKKQRDKKRIEKIHIEKQFELYHVQFVRTKAIILAKSIPHLNALTRLMNKFPDFEVMVTGHTDNSGGADILMKLSVERAEAIKGKLVHSGIAPERIHTRGFGGTRPLNGNETERDRKVNRRVEFAVYEGD